MHFINAGKVQLERFLRSFELDPTVGELRYYLKPGHVRQGKVRGYLPLLGWE